MNYLNVNISDKIVGKIFEISQDEIAFEYDKNWLQNGYSIDPFDKPLKAGVYKQTNKQSNNQLINDYSIFDYCKPPKWIRLFLVKELQKVYKDFTYENLKEMSELEYLSILHKPLCRAIYFTQGKGFKISEKYEKIIPLCREAINKLYLKFPDNLVKADILDKKFNELSTQRCFILAKIDNEDWLIKKYQEYKTNSNILEFEYLSSAKALGINVPRYKIFPSKICTGYIGTQRFDIENGKFHNSISAYELLNSWKEELKFDYIELMKMTLDLNNKFEDVIQIYKRMCFNVFSYNCDDHVGDFVFIYKENENCYRLAPAIDLIYCKKEHILGVNGNYKDPGIENILEVAKTVGIEENLAKEIALKTKQRCDILLKYLHINKYI